MLAESSAAPLTALATAIDNCQTAQSAEQGQASLHMAISALQELAIFAELADQAGLWSSCNMLAEQIKASAAAATTFTPPAQLAQVVSLFAVEPSDVHAQQLLALLSDPLWSTPLAGEDLNFFAEWLAQDTVISSQLLNLATTTTQAGDTAVHNPESEQWLNDLAELEASAARIELDELDVFSLLDDISLLLNSEWSINALSDSLLAVSIAAHTQQIPALEAVCRHLLQSINRHAELDRASLTEQLPLLLLDASMIGEDELNDMMLRIDALFSANQSATNTQDDGSAAAAALPPETTQAELAGVAVNSDMLAILCEELTLIAEQLNDILASNPETAHDICELLDRLAQACTGIGMHPLAQYLQAIQTCARQIAAPDWLADHGIGLVELAPWLSQYCAAPNEEANVDALIGILLLLGDTREAELDALRASLLAQTISSSTPSDLAERQKVANPADVSLAVPDDISAELMEGLLQELPIQAGAFAQAMQKVVSGQGTLADLDIAKRAAHTLKGAANTVGIAGVANLTHHLEDILIALSDAEQMPDAHLANLLTEAGDCLESMAEALMGTGPNPSDSLPLFQRILDCANRIDTEGINAQAPIENSHKPIPSNPAAQAEQTEQIEAMVRIPARLVDDMLNLLGESIVSVAQMRELLTQSAAVNQRMRTQNQTVQHLVGELEQRIEARSLGQSNVASPHQDFDALEFESYNELHSISRRLTEATTDSRELALETESLYQRLGEAIEAQHRLQVSNQEVVMRTRMVPVSTIEARLQRAARQTARLLDKEVALTLHGESTLVDSHLLNTMVDPLMHVLRNAIDHGIESPEHRLAKGKVVQGQISLSFAREGNSIVVRCKDDGAGLDLPAIRRKAERIGIITPDTVLSHNETARLILRHGFSIRDEASQVSGRGIGMDIVLSTVNALKGNLILHSEQATGLQIEMRFPVSLVASHALLVEAHQQRIAISSSGILDLAYFDSSEVLLEGEQRYIQMAEHKIPLLELESLFGLPQALNPSSKSGLPAIVLQLDSGALKAVQVQRVIDSRDIVVKDLGQFVPRIPGVLGATILGDGGVASVVDLRELLDNELIALNALQGVAAQESHLQLPRALVIDDSISARRATTQVMRDAGFEVRPALDGLDAIEQLENWQPDIVIVDMEMPRMNGLELAAYFRSQAHLQHIPIIMITSRSTEKHRRQASLSGVSCYLVKPFNEEALLNNVFSLLEQQQAA